LHAIRCVATTPTDANCTSNWVPYMSMYHGYSQRRQSRADTLTDCQNGCEFDPRCVAVDWLYTARDCWINTNANHMHSIRHDEPWSTHGRHYDLVSRCNITGGQCFQDVLTF